MTSRFRALRTAGLLAAVPGLAAAQMLSFGEVDAEGLKIVESLYSGYGEGAPRGKGPEQHRIETEGAKYLEKDFSLLDKITSATIVGDSAPAKKGGKKKM